MLDEYGVGRAGHANSADFLGNAGNTNNNTSSSLVDTNACNSEEDDLKTPLPLTESWASSSPSSSSSSSSSFAESQSPLEYAESQLLMMGASSAANPANASSSNTTTAMSDAGWGKVRLVQMAAGADSSWVEGEEQEQEQQQGGGQGASQQQLQQQSFARPPTPLEILDSAWEMVVSERVEGSCTACVVTLDGRLNQLSYANLGDSGVILLRHADPEVSFSLHVF
jgi:hypothetical protein